MKMQESYQEFYEISHLIIIQRYPAIQIIEMKCWTNTSSEQYMSEIKVENEQQSISYLIKDEELVSV